MTETRVVLLEFNSDLNAFAQDKSLSDGLSVALQIEETLWVANDQSISLERLSLVAEEKTDLYRYGQHAQFSLHDYLRLPVPPRDRAGVEEADVEGLNYQAGYLWLVGSHSLKRTKPKLKDGTQRPRSRWRRWPVTATDTSWLASPCWNMTVRTA